MNRKQVNKPALIVSISLLIMTLAAGFSYGYVYSSLIDLSNEFSTMTNLVESEIVFIIGIVGWGIVIVTDFIVTFALYIYLKSIDKRFSFLTMIFRLIYTFMLCIAVFKQVQVISLINNFDNASQVVLKFESFESIWAFGLMIFGVHLFFLGLTTLKTLLIPKFLGVLLLIAAISYIITNTLIVFVPSLESFAKILDTILSVPMAIGELVFAVWLLIKGRKLNLN